MMNLYNMHILLCDDECRLYLLFIIYVGIKKRFWLQKKISCLHPTHSPDPFQHKNCNHGVYNNDDDSRLTFNFCNKRIGASSSSFQDHHA